MRSRDSPRKSSPWRAAAERRAAPQRRKPAPLDRPLAYGGAPVRHWRGVPTGSHRPRLSKQQAIHDQQDYRADHRHDEPDGIIGAIHTERTANPATEHATRDADQCGDYEPTRVTTGHE